MRGSEPPAGSPEAPAELAKYEAVRHLVERAVDAQPALALTGKNAPAVAAIRRQTDGLPLALELAAARLRTLTVKQVRDRLEDLWDGNSSRVP